jgi:sugar/nucleoside kinase (ribokinase family)
MSSDYDVLLWGMYFCDLIFTGLPEVPRLGAEIFSSGFDLTPGGPFTTTVAMQRLGLRVGWECDFGDDLFSKFILDAAGREGIDGSLFQVHPFPVRRVSAAFSFAHDRGFVSFMDDVVQTSAIPFIKKHRPRCLFLPHLHYGDAYTDLFAAARMYGAMVFMDCQCTEGNLETPGVVDALRSIDVFAPNETEALHLTGAATIEQALARLAELTPLVVIKLGADGAMAQSARQIVRAPAIPVHAVDTTGAGDCFNAGFLYSFMHGASLEMCLQSGNICGGLSTTAVGGTAAAPAATQVEAYRASIAKNPWEG